jgi:hypothetical protein
MNSEDKEAPNTAMSEAPDTSSTEHRVVERAPDNNASKTPNAQVAASVTAPVSDSLPFADPKTEALFQDWTLEQRARVTKSGATPPFAMRTEEPTPFGTVIETPCYSGRGFVRRLISWGGGSRRRTFAILRRLYIAGLLPPSVTHILAGRGGLLLVMDASPAERAEYAAELARIQWATDGRIPVLDGEDQTHHEIEGSFRLGHQAGDAK